MQLIVNIIVLSAIYALIACGYVLIYRVSRVLNLAHGELMMLGAYLLLATATSFGGNPIIAIGVAVLLSLLVGALVYIFLMRRMTGEMVLAAVLTTVALGILLRGLIVLIWSAQQQYPGHTLGIGNPALALPGGARISTFAALLVTTTALVYAALFAFLRFGRWGVRMRAAGQNPLLAAQRGIPVQAIARADFADKAAHDSAIDSALGALGAEAAFDHYATDFGKEARALTDGRGVDIVVEHVGEATWDRSVRALANGGRLVTCGATTGAKASLDLRHLFARQLSFLGSYMGGRAELLEAATYFFAGSLDPVIDVVLPLAEAATAQIRLESRAQFGKIVLTT